MNSMTEQERWEWEQELREEARREHLEEMHHERCMAEDPDYAYDYITRNISKDWINTYHYLKRECRRYDLDFKELLENL